jgi:hypothetical protein
LLPLSTCLAQLQNQQRQPRNTLQRLLCLACLSLSHSHTRHHKQVVGVGVTKSFAVLAALQLQFFSLCVVSKLHATTPLSSASAAASAVRRAGHVPRETKSGPCASADPLGGGVCPSVCVCVFVCSLSRS